ncbi:DNA mismatch repair endonuclease MutL [Alteromonas hispanica]|uniref:DNA mismatch repair protein MutL n=1 Tax=Alteromonas hispanica TaxID=315421 RepID=A0A6L9MSN4_9ALTE|nr:DNA mismatch repair endonuclease MutL [Alteromonas hispanica]NDW21117.1 DNA mismatch repair endonuclease MutL [Alteromonas hispanica]
MPIQLLSPQLANQIAAGEVVERPASVVKELLENSVDAGAAKIEIDIEKGGHKRIRIKDNGAGIAKDELQLALSRHATSKISTLDDLEQILSLGFRGEALASISSVTRLTLTSKTQVQNEAWEAYCEGRDMAVAIRPAAHPVGTTIDVADLFYNTPARRKFLRTEKTEFQHIEDVVKRVALSYPHVSFILKHNDKVVKRYIADKEGSIERRIAAVVGQKFVQNAVHINTHYDGITIDAWLGNETMLRSSNDCQFSFVNSRGMRDKLIMHAIRQAYESVWGVLEQPSFVVYLSLDPKDVDVNVHPAKHEVRFQQSRLVHDFICKSVCDALHALSNDLPEQNNSASASHQPNDYMTPTVEHGYIRPLSSADSTTSPAHRGSSNDSFTGSVGSSFVRSQEGLYGGVSTSGNTSSAPLSSSPSSSSPLSSPLLSPLSSQATPSRGRLTDFQRQAKGPTAAYQAGFNALMTPKESSIDNDASNELMLSSVNLTSHQRLYVNQGEAYLLSTGSLVTKWLLALIFKAEHGQPLLMPVAINADDVSNATLEVLAELHFDINKVAGKYRLQQVPAGTRHLPWIKWFEYFLCAHVDSVQNIVENVVVPQQEIDEQVDSAIWYWLEQQSQSKQWEYIEQFAKVRSINDILSTWGE